MQAKHDTRSALVLVLGVPGDTVAAKLATRLRAEFEVETVEVESAAALREVVERRRDRLDALVVGAADSTAASTLVWDLDHSNGDLAWLSERTLVVVDSRTTLEAVPARLLGALPYRAVSEGALEQLVELVELLCVRPRELDLLASLVRSAIAGRGVDSLPPLLGDWSGADSLAPEQLLPAHVGDGGRRANPLWAHWTRQRDGAALERLTARLAAHQRGLARARVQLSPEPAGPAAAAPAQQLATPTKQAPVSKFKRLRELKK